MANTIRAAKNTFLGGLVMDLSPDTTPNEVLTSALNATLITFNGNEMLLQNDMGNGRVETARLPDGYIPVGTCEFGDIIYIVSYNPLTNKSQIGCFPSPERNISSEETGSTNQCLSAWDFLTSNGAENNPAPTGELIASSVKKILYNNKLNPGDKFIIYDKGSTLFLSSDRISDIGNISHQYGAFPKYLKIHVIAIEDSGKINFLDSTLRWYDNKEGMNQRDYFITTSHTDQSTNNAAPDIDSYRNLLSSGYSVFQSKISGKLALLIELEKITGFSCTYNVFGKEEGKKDNNGVINKDYEVYWNVSWETDDNNINPEYIVLTKSQWSGKDNSKTGMWYYWVPKRGSSDEYELSSSITMEDPPKAFYLYNNDVKQLQSDYKYWDISKGNETTGSLATDGTFENFVENTSYDSILKKFINALITSQSYYENIALTKLNIVREGEYQIPKLGEYYINATKLEYIKSTDEHELEIIETKVYTLIPNSGNFQEIQSVDIPDVIVNDYFNQPIYLQYHTFSIPIRQEITKTVDGKEIIYKVKPDTTNLIYNYEITPAMPYGLLSEFAIEGYIDFSKIGTGAIDLNVWKYFIGDNSCSLTIGMDAYVEDNMGIERVVLEFYDNQGFAAAYHITDKESYSGQFTEVIPLNGVANTYKLLNKDALNNIHVHLGTIANEGDSPVYAIDELTNEIAKTEWEQGKTTYLDDCGTLYTNMLYFVRIVIKYCPKNALGDYDTSVTTNYKYFHRWVWTTSIFNEYYHRVTDFDDIPLTLTLDVAPTYMTTEDWYYGVFGYNSPNMDSMAKAGTNSAYKFLSANVQVISSTDDINAEQIEDIDNPDNPYNPDDQEPEYPPVTQSLPSVSVEQFKIDFNRNITEVDLNKVQFVITIDGSGGPLQYGIDYNIVSGEGAMAFVVVFSGLPDTYSMHVSLAPGAIKLQGNEQNNNVDLTYSFINGHQQ